MAPFQNRKKVSRKPSALRKQKNVNLVSEDKRPKSLVFAKSRITGPLKQLEMDLRKVMSPLTALNLKENKRNKLKDFLNVARPMGVTHFLILSKSSTSSWLRVATTPQGPTLTFKIHEFSLATEIAQSQVHPRCPKGLFMNSPLMVLSGFGTGEEHLKLAAIMFQNIFPTIDVNTVRLSSCQRIVLLNYQKDTKLIDFRHYSIRLQPVGVSRRIRKFVHNHHLPDLSNLQDVSDFISRSAGYGSESEAEEGATVTVETGVGRTKHGPSQNAVKLQEIGPRMTLELVKVEEGLCCGSVNFPPKGEKTENVTEEI